MSQTDPAKSASNCSGYDIDVDYFAVGQLPETYTALNSFCCLDTLVFLSRVISSFLMISVAPLFVVASFDG